MLTIPTQVSPGLQLQSSYEPIELPSTVDPGCQRLCDSRPEATNSATAESNLKANLAPSNSGIEGLANALKASIDSLSQSIVQVLIALLGSPTQGADTATEPSSSPSIPQSPCCPSSVGSQAPEAPKDSPSEAGRPSNTFVWKPASEKDGKLAVVIPAKFTPDVVSVVLRDPSTNKVIAQGRPSGVGNGQRAHYRFSKPGSEYPKKVVVEVELKSGAIKRYSISDSSHRTVRN
jgi:hypothetical protein